VITRHEHDLPPATLWWWDPERVALTLDDEHRHADGVELGQPALRRIVALPGWVDRESEAEDGGDIGLAGRAAGHAGAGRAATCDHRELAPERTGPEPGEHRQPRRVELAGGRWRAPAGDPVRLLDEHDVEAGVYGSGSRRDQVRCADPAARAVAEDEASAPLGASRRRMEIRPSGAVGRLELERLETLLR
jgi:hypothetical protein